MRLVAWNCCGGPLERKLAILERLTPDIAVIPECPRLPPLPGQTVWRGLNPRKGLGVVARPPWQVRPARRSAELPHLIYPVEVSGPETFHLWAVWACHWDTDRYVRAVHRLLDRSHRRFRGRPVLMLGDFNSNSIWDHQHRDGRSHSALVTRLSALGLESAYHVHCGERQGRETQPTFYEYRHADRPYHLDYCFLPTNWTGRIRTVSVGAHEEWSAGSDHMPVLVELE